MQSPAHRRAVSGDPPPPGPWPRAVAGGGGGLCGGASHEAEGRRGARGGGAGRVGPPTGWHCLRLLRQIGDQLVPGVEQFLLVDDVIAVEDGAALPRGRCIRHAPEAAPRAVGPLAVPVIEPAFQAALMPRVRLPPLVPLRGRAAVIPTVRLPPVAGPTDGEHRPAPRPAAPHRAPRHGSGHRPGTPRRLRRVRRRRGVTGETDRPAWADGGARPGGRRSRTHGSRRLRDRTTSRPWKWIVFV